MTKSVRSKLDLRGERVSVREEEALRVLGEILLKAGCNENTAVMIAEHLVDTSLCGMESHGVMRVLQYVEQMQSGLMSASGEARLTRNEKGAAIVDGDGGSGIPAMLLAFQQGQEEAKKNGVSAVAIKNVGHTGRHGAYADEAALAGYLTICVGGGNRKNWRQVAPFGGAKGMLPTNPWCVGIPGGDQGPVVLDFATSKIAGGWIYAARSAGALLPEGCVIDRDGNPTRDPEDYFNGGAILPSGGHKGYALALMAELMAEAMLGSVETESNWLLITLDTGRYREENAMRQTAEEILEEMRSCPPAPGFERVEVPGERERDHRAACNGVIAIPEETWKQILALEAELVG